MGARDDIPRERGYDPAIFNPVRANAPFTPATGNSGASANVPVVGLLAIGGLILLFEHFRRGK